MRLGERSDVSISSVPYVSETMRVGWMGADIVRPASSVMLRVSLCGAGVTEQAGRRIATKTVKKREKSFFSMMSLTYFRIKSFKKSGGSLGLSTAFHKIRIYIYKRAGNSLASRNSHWMYVM